MIDLLAADVMNGRAGRDCRDGCSVGRRVAADVARSRVFDALFGFGVLGTAGRGPVRSFGFPVDDKAWECVL